jgi:ABC-2 type transport system ATP-binding protein
MAYAQQLLEKFHLEPNIKIKNMSRGEKARIGLITALAHRPQLLVLDEPSSGLDVSVRYDILSEVIRSVTDSGRTILFSSHLLDEVERITDNIIMINKGKKIIDGHVDSIKAQHYRYIVKFADETDIVREFLLNDSQLIRTLQQDGEWLVVARIPLDERLHKLGGEILEAPATSLENIFMDYCSLENYHGK